MPNRRIHAFSKSVFSFIILIFLVLSPFSTNSVFANSMVVETELDLIADDGLCSLREAIINANDGAQTHPDCASGTAGKNLITLADEINTITLQGEMLPVITSEIRIEGNGRNTTFLQAATCDPTQNNCLHHYPVFVIDEPGDLTLQGLTVRHGNFSWYFFRAGPLFVPGMGGGINNFGKLSLLNCNVSQNLGEIGGGIINLGELLIEDSHIRNNKAVFGAGLLNSGDLVMKDSYVSNNTAGLFGGGVANTQFSFSLDFNDALKGSIAEKIEPIKEINADIALSQINDNSSRFIGGGLLSGGWISIVSNISETGETEPTYEILVDEKIDRLPRPAVITMNMDQTTVSANTSEIGGGIATVDTLNITASTLSGNRADFLGGGLAALSGLTNVTNSTFSANTAGSFGGGLFSDGGMLNLTQNTLNGNIANGEIFDPGPLSIMDSAAILEPEEPGGGLFAASLSRVNLSNTIIGNSSGADCYTEGKALGRNVNNLVEDGSCDAMLDGDPGLFSLTNNGGATLTHALQNSSPAIDQGDPSVCYMAPTNRVDQRGERRYSDACDIGAFEYYQPSALPETGFTQGVITSLPPQPAFKAYANTSLTLEIPVLESKATIVGVPQSQKTWDVAWLGNAAGYLYGSAFPTWSGNTVITGHVWNADDTPGIFSNLKALRYGDQVIINAFGRRYTYEVRDVRLVGAGDLASVFQPEELDWVTLVTCETYNTFKDVFNLRRVVRAVLVSID